jgi:hypothetical protein
MISGRQALSQIESAIAKARGSESELDAALRSAEAESARLRAERTGLFKELARVKIDAFQSEGIVNDLDLAERRALALVKDRSATLTAQASSRDGLYKSVQKAETERHALAVSLEQALAALDKVKLAAEPKIRASAPWKAQQEKITAAIKIAEESEKKALLAETDREQKRKPYEADMLFMYLWKAKFGLAEYTGGNIARFFDRMIARKVGYPEARANYTMLNEIPQRLREHAERRLAAVDPEKANLAKAEGEALKELGAGDLVTKVEAARLALVEAEKSLSAAKSSLAAFETRTAAAAADPAYDQAIQLLSEADARQDIQELYRDAARTRTKDDERLVRAIEGLDAKLAKTEEETGNVRFQVRDMARRRADIERERDSFRQSGYDNPYGSFGNNINLGSILGGILQGAIQGAILRDTLRDGYRQQGGGSVFGPWTAPDNTHVPPSGGQWVPPWLDNGGSSGGGSWGGGDSGGGSSGGGDGFSTGGGV